MNVAINIIQSHDYEIYEQYLPAIRKEFKKFAFTTLEKDQVPYVVKIYDKKEDPPIAFFVIKNNHIIQKLFVFPNHRGKGIGTLCINYVAERYGRVRIFVRGKNKRAINFYEKNNFKQTRYFERHNIYQYDLHIKRKI